MNLTQIQWLTANGCKAHCTVARLDLLHPVISGNKYFKLKYNLTKAVTLNKGLITMGGAFSNHLAATAFACNKAGIPSVGLIRGEVIDPLNSTLSFCKQQGMQLIPIPRNKFSSLSIFIKEIRSAHPHYLFVPEGGSNEEGEKGCTEIAPLIHQFHTYTHIACAVGTGTTVRGLLQSLQLHQTMLAVPVLKIKQEEQSMFLQQHLSTNSGSKIEVLFDYAGKGYAKKEKALFKFMNEFYNQTNLPLDFVYTAKLMMAVDDLYGEHFFSETDRLLVIHTGGLQGNQSLQPGTLIY